METIKRLISIILVCAFYISQGSCGISKEDTVGTWSSTYEYDGYMIDVSFVLDEDGDYAKVTYQDGSLSSIEAGTWEIRGGNVILHRNGNTGVSEIYSYKDGVLVNDKHEFRGGISKEDAVGTWSSTYEYGGNTIDVSLVLDMYGEYTKATYQNGTLRSTEEGIWEIDAGKVVLHKDGNTSVSFVYFYRNGALDNNGNQFYKE